MIPVVTGDEYRRVDQAYEGDLTRPMERAGHAVALSAIRVGRLRYGRRAVVLAGPGNNGGDGYVAARLLAQRGVGVEVQALGDPKTDVAAEAAHRARSAGVRIRSIGSPVPADVVVDALFGGGVRSGLPTEVDEWMDVDTPVVAVDYPTGLDPDTGKVEAAAFRAEETVTFGTIKTGHVLHAGPDHCGEIVVADIGIGGGEPSMFIAERDDAPRPSRLRKTHKWSAGAVLVVGGSRGMVGAAVLAGRAALEFGAGTVYLATPEMADTQSVAPDLPAIELSSVPEKLGKFDVVIAGPGLHPDDEGTVAEILERAGKVVLDAGALTTESLGRARSGGAEVIATPHDAEFKRLAGVGAGTFSVRSYAGSEGLTVIRKGNPTMVTDGGLPILVRSGGPELASIGTGDVLAGMVGALWARGLDATSAAISGAFWHGEAGKQLARRESVTATKLLSEIGRYAW